MANTVDIADRASWWYQLAYRGGSQRKRMARDFGFSEATAKRLLNGARPTSAQLEAMIGRWGAAFVQFVFAPAGSGPWSAEADAARLALVEARLATLEASYREEADDLVRTAPPALAPLAALALGQESRPQGQAQGGAGEAPAATRQDPARGRGVDSLTVSGTKGPGETTAGAFPSAESWRRLHDSQPSRLTAEGEPGLASGRAGERPAPHWAAGCPVQAVCPEMVPEAAARPVTLTSAERAA